MSKRPHMSIASKINKKAEEMAITWQLKEITERAAREMRRPVRPPPKCRFCQEAHTTASCHKTLQQDKMQECVRLRICQICLTHAGHHAANCRGLRNNQLLCTRRGCGSNYNIHHVSICEEATPPQSPNQSPRQEEADN